MRRRLRLAGQLPACLPAFSPPACVARPSPSAPTNCTHTSQDIEATWESFIKLLDYNQGLARYGAPGRWNDLDMLEGGRVGGLHVRAGSSLPWMRCRHCAAHRDSAPSLGHYA